MKKKLIIILALILIITPMVFAEDLIFRKNEIANLQINCKSSIGSACSGDCSISINYPNKTEYIYYAKMSNNGYIFNYSMTNTSTIGLYTAIVNCSDTLTYGTKDFSFYITEMGKEKGGDLIIVIFSLLFIIIFIYFIYSIVNGLKHFIEKNMDILDLVKIWISYLVFWVFYILSLYYWDNEMAIDFLKLFIDMGLYTQIMIPFFAWIALFIYNGFMKVKPR